MATVSTHLDQLLDRVPGFFNNQDSQVSFSGGYLVQSAQPHSGKSVQFSSVLSSGGILHICVVYSLESGGALYPQKPSSVAWPLKTGALFQFNV